MHALRLSLAGIVILALLGGLGGIVLALGGILNMGLFLKVGSMFIVGVTGLSHAGWALPLSGCPTS